MSDGVFMILALGVLVLILAADAYLEARRAHRNPQHDRPRWHVRNPK